MTPPFQHFNDLEASRYEELRRDISERGVLIPILVDEVGTVIDGHQRRRVCAELHLDCPSVVVPGLSDDEKHQLAIVLNLYRRQLSGVERSKVIGDLARMHLSTRRIGAILGVAHTTVLRNLPESSGGADAPPERREGADGKSYPASRPTAKSEQLDTPPLADENGEPLPTGSEPREDEGGSDDEGASTDEGVGSRSSDPALSAPSLGAAAHPDDSYRSRMSREFAAVRNGLLQLAVDRMLEVSDLERRGDIEETVRKLRAWCDAVDAGLNARPRMEMVK